jgi:hypothetical protein
MATFQIDMRTDDRRVKVAFRDWERQISTAGERTAKELARIGEDTAQALAPDGPARSDYGRRMKLKDNIRLKWTGSKSFQLMISVVNAMAQETGAGGHVIEGNPYLHFFWERAGEWVRTTSVDHPGNPAFGYMLAAFEAMDSAVDAIADRTYP